jgi:hypothetical protein
MPRLLMRGGVVAIVVFVAFNVGMMGWWFATGPSGIRSWLLAGLRVTQCYASLLCRRPTAETARAVRRAGCRIRREFTAWAKVWRRERPCISRKPPSAVSLGDRVGAMSSDLHA